MVSQHALLKVSGVVYALHHPAGPHDPASWDADFGYLITMGMAPWWTASGPTTSRRRPRAR